MRETCLSCTLRVTCVTANNGCFRSIMIWVWIWLSWLGTFELLNNFLHLVVEQLLNPILPSNHVSRRSLEEDEVTHILSRVWLLQFPSEQLSDGISWECFVKNDSVRPCLTELQSFLQSKVDVDPIHRILMFLQCFFSDAVLPSRSCQDPYVLCPWDPEAERILSVCCPIFDLQVSIPNWWWNVNWLHIRHDKCIGRNRPE